jgi:hypothetical protein
MGGFAEAVQGADDGFLLVTRGGDNLEIVEKDEVLRVGKVDADENSGGLVVDTSGHLFGGGGVVLGEEEEFKDLFHLLVVFELVAFRDRGKAGGPVEVVSCSLEDHDG